MNHYMDIVIKPDVEMRENVLLNKAYTKLHKVLVTLSTNAIGISFPEYRVKLGKTIRIHGDEASLQGLQKMGWLGGLNGYCQISDIQTISDETGHRVISRIQSNMSQSKLNRLIKRGSISPDEIKKYRALMFSRGLDNPYLELESGSTGRKHRRYIQFGEIMEKPVVGEFDTFGLSKTATVPWF